MMISAYYSYHTLHMHIHKEKSLFHYKLSISLNELCYVAAAVVHVIKIIVFVSNFDCETFDAFYPTPPSPLALLHFNCYYMYSQSNNMWAIDLTLSQLLTRMKNNILRKANECILCLFTGGGELGSENQRERESIFIEDNSVKTA